MLGVMKIVVQVKLLPDAVQAPVLEATLHAVNDAADAVSAVAFSRRVFLSFPEPNPQVRPPSRLPAKSGQAPGPDAPHLGLN